MANREEVINFIKKHLEKTRLQVLQKFTDKATKQAQINFNAFIPEVSSDKDTRVQVVCGSTSYIDKDTIGRKIECKGNQVAFIEFGVGVKHYNTFFQTIASSDLEMYNRPKGIDIGGWGKHQGLDDYWIRPSYSGVPMNAYEMPVAKRNKQGEVIGWRTDVVWTEGHRPARALWRAIRSSEKKLLGGKLK